MLLLFLRSGRSTIVIALAIPTSLIGTFLMLNLMGRSLNVISLAGLAFAVGMLVDNAVVVLENCYRHSQMGDNPFAAAVRGAKEVWGAVVASTLTTLAVFLPVLFVEEEAGQLFRDIALAISSAVGLSLIVSVTVIPTAAARLLAAAADDADGEDDANVRREAARRRRPACSRAGVDRLGRHVRRRRGRHQPLPAAERPAAAGDRGRRSSAWPSGLSWLLMPKVEYLPDGQPQPGVRHSAAAARLQHRPARWRLGTELEDATRPYWDVDRDDPAARRQARLSRRSTTTSSWPAAAGLLRPAGRRRRCGPASWSPLVHELTARAARHDRRGAVSEPVLPGAGHRADRRHRNHRPRARDAGRIWAGDLRRVDQAAMVTAEQVVPGAIGRFPCPAST